ncbi:MAG TPA: hypothetical protein VL309_00895 [Vicinamibacterales bacterium]|jgi:hypothetical protein|nr:hypothetical protein [Vicinamibacterales bacterium]
MPKQTRLDQQWEQLMLLCETETKFQASGRHPKVLRLITSQIEELAADLGFTRKRIATRDFRAERRGGHIARILND